MRNSLLQTLRTSLKNVSKFRKMSTLRGGIEGIAKGVLFGWVVHRSHPQEPLRLEVIIDGTTIGLTETNIPRPDIGISAPSGYLCGFQFDLRPHVHSMTGQELQIRDALSGTPLDREPLVLDPGTAWGVIDKVVGLEVGGWAVIADPLAGPPIVDIFLDGKWAGSATADQPRPDLLQIGLPYAKCGFLLPVPCRWNDGKSHTVTARVRGASAELRGGGLPYLCSIRGNIEILTENRVTGWILNSLGPQDPACFDLWINGRCIKKRVMPHFNRPDVADAMDLDDVEGRYPIGFDIAVPPLVEWDDTSNWVVLCLPGTRENLLGRVGVSVDQLEVVSHLERIAAQLRQENSKVVTHALLRTQIVPEVLKLYRSGSFQKVFMIPDGSRAEGETAHPQEDAEVDVVIPVYKGYRETLDCIHSVLEARDKCPMELIVINDQSPDSKLTEALRRLAVREGFTLLENEKNQGFVGTVNVGMRQHPHRDVVLLNSDTVVPKGWLQGLRRAAYSASDIATATPFSNRATIFSLPRACFDNDMPLGLSVDALHGICARCNPSVTVDVPTAVGFCMYIRRDAIDEVGPFDEKLWDKGYGEENDFCMRAKAMGWRHVAACDVFVQHHGAVSFDMEKSTRIQANLAKINALYPEYPKRIKRFLETDPLAVPRARVNIEIMKHLAPSYRTLVVNHGLGGGTEKLVRDLCEMLNRNGDRMLFLRSTPSGTLRLAPAISAYEETIVTEYPLTVPMSLLAEHLRDFSIEYVYFHHTLGFKTNIWELPILLDVPYDVMLHDFYLVCPRINLIDGAKIYCGQPDTPSCEVCCRDDVLPYGTGKRLKEVGGSVADWRDFHREKLLRARRVMTPSEDARRRILRYLPDVAIDAIPHPEPPFSFEPRVSNDKRPFSVAIIGAIGPHKGFHLLLACAKYAQQADLPLRFVVIGYTCCDEEFADLENVVITGPYKQAELPQLIRESGCTVALFLSVWPETFSYTLSEAWRAGLYPVALDIGAPADRIREMGIGKLIPFTQRPGDILYALMDVLIAKETGKGS